MGRGPIEEVPPDRGPNYRLIPFERRHFEQLRSWVRSEREALEWGGAHVAFPLTDGQLEAMLPSGEPSPRAAWMLELDGVAAGHAQAVLDWSGNAARIARVIVDPKRRGAGVGRALLDEVTRTLFRLGFQRLNLNVYMHNMAARSLYETFGFTACGLRRNAVCFGQEQWDVLQMEVSAWSFEALRKER